MRRQRLSGYFFKGLDLAGLQVPAKACDCACMDGLRGSFRARVIVRIR